MKLGLTSVAVALGMLALTGCRDGDGLENLARVTDRTSLERLAAMPEGALVALSLDGHQAMDGLPELGESGRRLSSFDHAFLVEVRREFLPELATTPGLKAIVVWGEADVARKLDPRLRLAMLSRLSGEELRATPLEVIARFAGDGLDLRHALEKAGADPRSVIAGVVTMSGTVDVLLEILAREDLVSMSKPVLQKPM